MRKHTFVILAFNESDDLEECIKSVLKQSIKSNVLIATSTPNDYIIDLASQYSLGVMVNNEKSNKGSDYNFALHTMNSDLITIAHQDDIYNRNYTKEILKIYEKNKDATIIFTDNYEINDTRKILKSKRLRRKKYYLLPLKYRICQNKVYFKMRSLRKEKFICTSSITFVKKNIPENPFPTNLCYNNDWKALIDMAREKTRFVFLDKQLVGYRINKDKFDIEKFQEDEDILKEIYPKWYFEKIVQKKMHKM